MQFLLELNSFLDLGVQSLGVEHVRTRTASFRLIHGNVRFEATRLIRSRTDANSLARPTPIVALTANALDGDRERCLAVGMNDYLAKPFHQAELHSIIERWCDPTRD